MESRRSVAWNGIRDMLPIVVGGVPFGLIAGVAAAEIHLGPAEAAGVSALIFAGAAQLATYDLIGRGAPFVVVFLTAVIINARFALYSAAIAPVFAHTKKRSRILYAYLLTDQAYAMTAARRLRDPDAAYPVVYYVASASVLWAMWIVATLVGASVGAAIPASWSLDFAVPLCFIALLFPALQDRPQLGCAAVTAAVAVPAMHAPQGTGVIISVFVGILAGAWFDRQRVST